MDGFAEGVEYMYAKAREIVAEMSIPEKVNLTTGVG
jgi:hypothetical protein